MTKHVETPLELENDSKKVETSYYIITHNDVNGHHCLDLILKLVGEAKVILKERNKLSSKELSLFDSEQLTKRDFLFLIECMPTHKAVEKIIELSKRVRCIFFFLITFVLKRIISTFYIDILTACSQVALTMQLKQW